MDYKRSWFVRPKAYYPHLSWWYKEEGKRAFCSQPNRRIHNLSIYSRWNFLHVLAHTNTTTHPRQVSFGLRSDLCGNPLRRRLSLVDIWQALSDESFSEE